MCNDKECPKRHECYRYMAIENPYRQAFFMDSPRPQKGECKEKWGIEGRLSMITYNNKP